MMDLCVRRVPVGKVKPGLVEALVRAQEQEESERGRGFVKGDVEGGQAVEGKSWSFAGMLGLGEKKVGDAVEVAKETLSGKEEVEHEGEEYGLVERFCAGVWSGLGMYQILSPFPFHSIRNSQTNVMPSSTQDTNLNAASSQTNTNTTLYALHPPPNFGPATS